MLTAKEVLRHDGKPVVAELTPIADGSRWSATMFALTVRLPEEVEEHAKELARDEAIRVAAEVGLDEDEANELFDEAYEEQGGMHAMVTAPFALCWN